MAEAAGATRPVPPPESSAAAEVLRVKLQLAEGGVLQVAALMTAAGGAQRAASLHPCHALYETRLQKETRLFESGMQPECRRMPLRRK